MAIGGFNGTDPAITLKQFKALVKSGDMKYYLSSGRSGNSKIEAWVEKVGKRWPQANTAARQPPTPKTIKVVVWQWAAWAAAHCMNLMPAW